LVLLLVIAYPIGMTITGSFSGTNGLTLEHYRAIIAEGAFSEVLLQSAVWTFGGTAIILVLGTVVALCLNEAFFGYQVARILLLLPWATPIAISALVWRWIYNEQYGILNRILDLVGLTNGRTAWLAQGSTGFLANLTVEVWSGLPLMTLIILSGLQSIPEDVYEASTVDGATWWQSLWQITLPMLRQVFLVASLMFIIWTFNSFPVIWVLTRGGPVHATDTLVTFIYKNAFQYSLFEEATALATITFVILLLISIPYARQFFKGEE
jgi:multiple sugar transport system permease protein